MSKMTDAPPYHPLELWFPSEPAAKAGRRRTDSRRASPPAAKVLTPSRPELSYPDRHLPPSRGASDMNETTAAPRGELIQLRGARDTRREFLLLDRAISALARRGSKKCRKTVGRMAHAFRTTLTEVSPEGAPDDALVMLGARCALCPQRCKSPVQVF